METETKSQFARDDPAFLVLLVICLCITSIGFAWTLSLSIGQSIYFLFYVVIVDFLFAGIIAATIFWAITNRFLRASQLDGDIEWGYSFDVHCNAFFPPLILLHFVQLFFYHGLSLFPSEIKKIQVFLNSFPVLQQLSIKIGFFHDFLAIQFGCWH